MDPPRPTFEPCKPRRKAPRFSRSPDRIDGYTPRQSRTTKCIFASWRALYLFKRFRLTTLPGSRGKRMKRLAVAVAAMALLSAGTSAQQTAKTTTEKASATAPPMATAHQPAAKTGSAVSSKGDGSAILPIDAQNQLVGQYCATCHSERGKAGGLVLAGFDGAKIEQHPDIAEKMIRKLRTGMMPPPNARRPEPQTIKAFVETLEGPINRTGALKPNT